MRRHGPTRSLLPLRIRLASWLIQNGIPEESFVDLYFNGEPHIHTSIYLQLRPDGEKIYGVLNSSHARWPIEYARATA